MSRVRTPRNNPFQPGWGRPLVWAGRRRLVEELTDVVLPRVKEGVKEAPRLIQHERGMGKTALLEVLRDEATDAGCIVAFVTAVRGENFTKSLARELAGQLEEHSLGARLTDAVAAGLRRLAGLTVGGVGVELAAAADDTDVASTVLQRSLVELAELARTAGNQVVVLVDEVQNVAEAHLAATFTALQKAAEHTFIHQHPAGGTLRLHLPLAVWVAGLPGSLARFKKARVTFGERCELVDFGPLDERDVREVLFTFHRRNDTGVVFDAEAIDPFVEAVGGYPYAFQLLGKAAWDAGEGLVITAADVATGARTVSGQMRQRYAARLEGLTDEQVAYLLAVAALDPTARTPTAACRRYRGDDTVPASRCGGMTQRLIDDHQILRVNANGRLELCLPGMDAYLRSLSG